MHFMQVHPFKEVVDESISSKWDPDRMPLTIDDLALQHVGNGGIVGMLRGIDNFVRT